MNIEEINKELAEYVGKHCCNCYAKVLEDGRIHLDAYFKAKHIQAIMVIYDKLFDMDKEIATNTLCSVSSLSYEDSSWVLK